MPYMIVVWWPNMETYIWVNIASGNGMLPDGTKPSSEPMLTNPWWGLLVPEGNFAQISILAMSLKIATPRLQPHFPRVNELRCHSYKEIFHFLSIIEKTRAALTPKYPRPPRSIYGTTWSYCETVILWNSLGDDWCAILIAHQIVMAKHGGSCVHFSGISTCGRTSRETVSHSQRQPLPNPHKIALPVYVTVTNKQLQPLTTTLYNSLVLSFSLLTTKQRLIKHQSFLHVLRSS